MKRLLTALLLVGVLVGAAVYNYRVRHAPPPAPVFESAGSPAGQGPVPVTVAVAERANVRRTITLVGALRTDRQAAISARAPARVSAVLVRDGDRVRTGQPLVRLDIADTRAQISGAEAAVRAADAQARKAVDGRRARAVEMDSQIAQAAGGVKTARAKLRQAQTGVKLTGTAAASDAAKAEAGVKQAQAGLDQAEYALRQAADSLKRAQFLYAHGGIPRADLEGAQTQADIARSQRDAAADALAQAKAALGPTRESTPLRTAASQADVDAARAGVQQADAGLRNARRAKTEALRIADQEIAAAQAQAAQARAGLAQVRAQIGSGALTSPLDGVVTDVGIRAGEVAQPGAPLMTILGSGSVYLEAPASIADAAGLRPGMAARVTIDTMPGRVLSGVVSQILPAAPDGRSLPVRIRIAASGVHLTPGVTATAVIDVPAARNVIQIPADAVRTDSRGDFVYVVENGRAARRNVRVGETTENGIQILSGLRSGETVIVSGPSSLRPGTPVQEVESPSS